jgi:transketolase
LNSPPDPWPCFRIGVGFAYAFKQDKKANHVYVLMGDGECQEGSVYEALAEAGRDQLNHLGRLGGP